MPGGFGGGAFGGGAFGGGQTPPEQADAPLDLYCFADGGIADLLSDPHVDALGAGTQFVSNPTPPSLSVWGGEGTTLRAALNIDSPVPGSFTAEWRVTFRALPLDFLRLPDEHVYLGAWSRQGAAVGLFFSRAGLAYTGAVRFSPQPELDAPFERIPGSHKYIKTGRSLVIRIAASAITGVAYVYVTPEDDLAAGGHQLRAVLPVRQGSDPASLSDRTLLSLRSTGPRVELEMERWCLYGAQLVPNLRPIANAGADEQVRARETARLDGRESFDPDGFALTYKWRLIDAPDPSGWILEGADGYTNSDGSWLGLTDRFRAPGLATTDEKDAILVGDVLLLGTEAHSIVGKGAAPDFELQLGERVLPDDLKGARYRVIRQRGVQGSQTARPTCYIEAPGFYRFDLVVNDGLLESTPSVVTVHGAESMVPRGEVPDLRFVFKYLSDFWELVEEKRQVPVFWSAVAQVTATELLTLWQHEYESSLRDIPRLILRRFLHYDTVIDEPNPDATTLRSVWGGVLSSPIPAGQLTTVTGRYRLSLEDVWHEFLLVEVPTSEASWAMFLQTELRRIDSRFSVVPLSRRDGSASVRVMAEMAFSLEGPAGTLLGSNLHPRGESITVLGPKLLRVDLSLGGIGVVQDDIICIGDSAFRIARVLDSPGDPLAMQRVLVKDALPPELSGGWEIPSQIRTRYLDFYRGLVSVGDLAEVEGEGRSASLRVCGANEASPTALLVDRSELEGDQARLLKVTRRGYLPLHPLIRDVPELSETLALTTPLDEEQVLRRNVDFFHETYRGQNALRFVAGDPGEPDVWEGQTPPRRLWAEHTYVDNAPAVEANFGLLADFRLSDFDELGTDADYLSVVRGLWYAYLRPPTLHTLRVATQILLGLPFAEQSGVIEEIRTSYTPSLGRILVREDDNPAAVRSYTYPRALGVEENPAKGRPYEAGDRVSQFAPLVRGAEVLDYVKAPGWFTGLVRQGVFTEVQKFNHFLVRVDSRAFSLETLLFVRKFLLRIRPPWTKPIFVVESAHDAEVDVSDRITQNVRLSLVESPCRDMGNAAYRFDEPDQSGGGFENQFDESSKPGSSGSSGLPAFPTPAAVDWGVDKNWLCPDDSITAITCAAHAGGSVKFDSGFKLDSNPSISHVFTSGPVLSIPPGGVDIGSAVVIPVAGALTLVRLEIAGGPGSSPVDYLLVLVLDGAEVSTAPFTAAPLSTVTTVAVATVVAAGDILSIKLRPSSGTVTREPNWSSVRVAVQEPFIAPWRFDEPLSAGDYCSERVL